MATPLVSAAMKRLEGKVAMITGAASGIDEATTRLFSKHRANVVITDIQDKLGNAVCKDLETTSSFVHCDVTKEEDVENAVNIAVYKYSKLDIMINNAGIAGVNNANILEYKKHEFEDVINVDVVGTFLGTKHAARVMIPTRRGSIINTTTVSSYIGGRTSHGYTSSKHAVVELMRNTAVELGAYGIRVNYVSPYIVANTPLAKNFCKFDDEGGIGDIYSNLKGANLLPKDVAEAALYLGSDESKYVSGHNLVIDGRFTIVNTGFCVFDGQFV